MAYVTNRVFEKRATDKSTWNGRVGHATLEVSDKGVWTLNGKELPAQSVGYLLTFSLQSLQDAYAGAADLAEATGNFEKKLKAVQDGTIGVRTGGVDEATKIGRGLAEAAFVAKHGKEAWEKIEDKVAKADEILAKNAAAFAPLVEAEIARRAAARAEKAKIAEKMGGLDL